MFISRVADVRTYNPASGVHGAPRCGLILQCADGIAKLKFTNSGVNNIYDLDMKTTSSNITPFIVDTNSDLHVVRSSIYGTKACVLNAGHNACVSGLSNKGIIFGGAAMDVSSAGAHSGSSTVYTGVFPALGSNLCTTELIKIYGFTTPGNNGTFACTASTTTTLTLTNGSGASETPAGGAHAIDTSYSATLPTSYYAGYGSEASSLFMDNVSTAIEISTNANQVFVNDLTVQFNSGNPTGPAVLVNGLGNQAVSEQVKRHVLGDD